MLETILVAAAVAVCVGAPVAWFAGLRAANGEIRHGKSVAILQSQAARMQARDAKGHFAKETE